MYDIGIPEIKCTERYEDINGYSIKYDAEAVSRPVSCPNKEIEHDGKNFRLHLHSSKHNLLRDTKSDGKLVYINLKIKRYRCAECGAIISDQFTFYDKHAHITNRLRDEFVNRCMKGDTYSSIAKDYGVDRKTVSTVFKFYVGTYAKKYNASYTPKVHGIDKTQVGNRYGLALTGNKQQLLP